MQIRPKIFALFILILAACVPHNTEAVLTTQPSTEEAKPLDVGSYLMYLQAKQDQDYDTAIRYLKKAVDKDPENKALHSELFILLAVEGQVDEAFSYALEELKIAPNSLLAALIVIEQYVKKGDYAAAQKAIEDFPSKDDNVFLFPLLEVWVQAGLKDKKKAKQVLLELNQPGTETLYQFHSALLHDMWGDADAAQEGYEALLAEPRGLSLRAAQAYGNFLLRQGDTKKFTALVDAYYKGARPYTLVDEIFFTAGADKANKKVPLSISTPQAGLAEAFFDISGTLADKGTPETSLFFLRLSLDLDPSLSLARILLGEIFEKQGRSSEALKLYESEKENSETYFASQVRAAMVLARMDRLDDAEKKLRGLAKKREEIAFPWVELGEIFLSHKQFEQAAEAFTEALNRIPVPNRAHWILFYSRGVCYEQTKKWDLAEQDFLQALMLSPNQPLTLNYLGYSWLERGKNVKKATEMLEKAAALSPREGFVFDSLGWAYYMTKNYDKAVLTLERAVELDPGSAVINDHLGDAYWRVDRQREAFYQWQRAAALDNDMPEADKERLEIKLKEGLDKIGDKINLSDNETPKKKAKNTSKKK